MQPRRRRPWPRTRACSDTFGSPSAGTTTRPTCPYGSQRRLEIARALATDPKLLLLDEPAAGMNPQETELLAVHAQAARRGLAILLIEHDMKVVMGVSDQVTVLDHGEMIAEGEPKVRQDPKVVEAYSRRSRADGRWRHCSNSTRRWHLLRVDPGPSGVTLTSTRARSSR